VVDHQTFDQCQNEEQDLCDVSKHHDSFWKSREFRTYSHPAFAFIILLQCRRKYRRRQEPSSASWGNHVL
jgi:hypothetical protein